MGRSIVEFMPDRSGHSCGYCKSTNGSLSDGMWAYGMTVQDYQDLIDRGWRRSGMYCYKPIMPSTCCPAYTIKCEALDVRLSKSQKKILKRMRKFLIDGQKSQTDSESDCRQGESLGDSDAVRLENIKEPISQIDVSQIDYTALVQSQGGRTLEPEGSVATLPSSQPPSQNITSHTKQNNSVVGRDSSRPVSKKAKLLRLERREKKLEAKRAQGCADTPAQVSQRNEAKTIEQFLFEPLPENSKHRLEVKLVNLQTGDAQAEEEMRLELGVYQKYQMAVHKDPLEKVNLKQFHRFLVHSPLQHESGEGLDCGYGSFHQQYWLDDKLIAVGVIDILPYCVSSVYFFYDPDYSFLSLGTYSSLREIALVRSLQATAPLLKYYYMGFYIHSCTKMRYKGRMTPSYLLCPEAYTWHRIDQCLVKLDQTKYARLDDSPVSSQSNADLNRVLILWRNVAVDYQRYKRLCKKQINTNSIEYYVKLVGESLSQRMLLVQ